MKKMPKIKLNLDSDLYQKLLNLSTTAGYSSPEEFVLHLIEKETALLEDAGSEEEMKNRLKGLGYIS
jgi:metal-responsive CopG/Arc/MetJ family transcriptional regulator